MTKTGLFSGQSNAVGNGPGGPFNIDSRVTVWNGYSNRDDATLLGSAWIAPDRNAQPFFEGCNHQGIWTSSYLARATGENQRLLSSARNGAAIAEWHTGSAVGPQYTRIMALRAAAGITTPFDWFGWNQGSADAGDTATYRTKWNAMIAKMIADGVITSTTPIFLSETAHLTAINPILQQIVDNDPRVGFARIGKYPTIDGAHFTGLALCHAGYEGVRAMAETTGTIFTNVVNPLALGNVAGTGLSRKSA